MPANEQLDASRIDNAFALAIQYLGHASVLIELDGIRLLTDPLLRWRTAHLARPSLDEDGLRLNQLDAVLISHLHLDHLDLPSMRRLPLDTPALAPSGSYELLQGAGITNVTEMRPGESVRIGNVTVRATIANHDGFRPPFGPRAGCVGYVVEGSRSIYFAGDTDLFAEMSQIGDNLELALLPVWGWGPTLGAGHLDPARAAEAATLLAPRVAVPIHWGTLCPIGMRWMQPRFLTEPPHQFARETRKRTDAVEVRIVQPGARTVLDRAQT